MLSENINALTTNWKNILLSIGSESIESINEFVLNEKKTYEPSVLIFPPEKCIFKCFDFFNFEETKVVILGQDPYINVGEAMGLCFSVPNDIKKKPPSLKNIFQELENEFDVKRENYDLTDWAEQGVLLLNTSLTVRQYKSNSHQKVWRNFTDLIIKEISDKLNGIIFILWGNDAKNKKTLIDSEKHHILESVHPSPLSAHRGFFGNNHFKKTNEILQEKGENEIKWV